MPDQVIQVLSFKSKETILKLGGSQSWALNPERARACKYAVICRNALTRLPEGPEPHHSAFMLGKISGIVPSTDTPGRWLILFSEYAECDWPNQWEGRNPVAYYNTDQYEYDFEDLDFKPVAQSSAVPSQITQEHVVSVNFPPLLEEHLRRRLAEGHFMDTSELIRHLVREDMARSMGALE